MGKIWQLPVWSQGGALDTDEWRTVGGLPWFEVLSRDPTSPTIDKSKYCTPNVALGSPAGNHCRTSGGVERWVYRYPNDRWPAPFNRVYGKILLSSDVTSPTVGLDMLMISNRLFYYGTTEPEATGVQGVDASAGGAGIWNIAAAGSAVVRTVNFSPYGFFTKKAINMYDGLSYFWTAHYSTTAVIKVYAFRLFFDECLEENKHYHIRGGDKEYQET